ncbi:MAG TPA: MlaD family protein [Chitinophagaceae bacterium]|nr:MlaD family protein [Chitinophagaceae bacterium]
MKLSNELKVGLLAVVALALLIIGFNFLKGKDLFKRGTHIYAVFKDLGTLEKSNQVKISGLPVGTVYDLSPKDKDVSGIVVTINLTRDVNIPKNSVAFITAGLVGSSYIVIERGNSSEYLQAGDTLLTRVENGFLGDVQSQINPTLAKVREAIDSLKVTLGGINRIFDPATKNNLQAMIANLHEATSSLKEMLNTQHGALARTLDNAASISENLKKNNDSITATISHTKRLTQKLADLNLQQTLDSARGALAELRKTLAKANSTSGTLGALLNDRQLYNKLNDAVLSAEILMDDLRVHPKRYVNLSIFGKKDKTGPLSSPTRKDSLGGSGGHP